MGSYVQRESLRTASIIPTGTPSQTTATVLWKEEPKMNKKYNIQLCPEECRYRSKLVPYCDYCLTRILKEREEKENAGRENKTENA